MEYLAGVNRRGVLLVCLLAVLTFTSCAVQYVSRYDEVTEQSITGIQRSVESLFQEIERTLGTPESDYENFRSVYQQLDVEAAMLNTRAQAIDGNSITAEQSQLLMAWLDNLEELHKTGFTNAEMIAITRQQGEQIFVAMLKFELAKKRQFDSAIIDGE
jgi:hypothetical protein